VTTKTNNIQRFDVQCIQVVHPDNTKSVLNWRWSSGGHTVEILDIDVPNEHRRKGIGRLMVHQLIHMVMPMGARLIYAITRTNNITAQQFYTELRFRIVAPLWNFYQDTDEANIIDALMYGRDLKTGKDA
jgi:ribosomal protein S18 acetylase RimI-like enzyme